MEAFLKMQRQKEDLKAHRQEWLCHEERTASLPASGQAEGGPYNN
jgi:hypothetical protein